MDLPKGMGPDHVPRGEIVLYLLKAEVKHRKFMRTLEQVGFDTALWSLDFSSLILDLLGFVDRTDEAYEVYNKLLESSVERLHLQDGVDNVNEVASDFYTELVLQLRGTETN